MGKLAKKILIIFAGLIVVLVIAFFAYFQIGKYSAQDAAHAALQSDAEVSVTQKGSMITFEGPDPDPANTRGLVFYPGAKVDEAAYAPLMHELARQGWHCTIVALPLDFAFFNINAADEPIGAYQQVEHWYVGGHSLGGVAAASYAGKHTDTLSGLFFAASFTTDDISASGLNVISAYGTEDGVLDIDSYSKNKKNLPSSMHELVIAGGNHAQFGDYGAQKGDGVATISAEEQVRQTVAFIEENASLIDSK